MIEKKFLNNIHRFNLIKLDGSKIVQNDDFIYYFKMIIKDSHIFVKYGYYSLLSIFSLFFLLTTVFFIPKKLEFKLFKISINFIKKISLCNEVLKFIKVHSLIFKYD